MNYRKPLLGSIATIVVSVAAILGPGVGQQAFAGWYQPDEIPIWDSTGLDNMPRDFYDNGLVKVPTVYMRELFLPAPSPDYYVPPNDWSVPDLWGIRRAARQYADEPIVILDIEAETALHPELAAWSVSDPDKMNGAIWRYQLTMQTWREENPDQIVCLYGFPRGSVLNALREGEDTGYFHDLAKLQKPITDLADCLTPAAYWTVDDPEAQLQNWQIKAEICREIYQKPCHFMVNLFNKKRDWQQHEVLTLRYSLKELRKMDGVAGIILWAPSVKRSEEYNQHLKSWVNMQGRYNYLETEWLRELNFYLGNPYLLP
jgi:hypothetical protein